MEEARQQRIIAAIQRNPGESNRQIAKRINRATSAEVQAARDALGDAAPKSPSDEVEAIPIGQKRVMPQKPQGSDCRRRIREIRQGVCHRVPAFAAFLGISEETLRKHAKALSCLKWVEMAPDIFEEAVMNPETAKQYFR